MLPLPGRHAQSKSACWSKDRSCLWGGEQGRRGGQDIRKHFLQNDVILALRHRKKFEVVNKIIPERESIKILHLIEKEEEYIWAGIHEADIVLRESREPRNYHFQDV